MPASRKSSSARLTAASGSRRELLRYARSVFDAEAKAILGAGERLGERFAEVIELILACEGQVVVTGLGKPGYIAQKLSATLASTGIRSLYLHPAEALHGDLGRVSPADVVLAMSNSGTTEELVRLVPAFRRMGVKLVAITGDGQSALAQGAELVLDIGAIVEACPLGLVPTASSAVMHAMADAIAMTLLKCRPFGHAEYATFHPGGKLGRSVMRVGDLMRTGANNPVVQATARLAEAVAVMTKTPGRPGATNVVDADGQLVGIFTDGDLRRLVERGKVRPEVLVSEVMGKRPRVIAPEQRAHEALAILREFKIDQLPVVDAEGLCVGLLDVQDLLSARVFSERAGYLCSTLP